MTYQYLSTARLNAVPRPEHVGTPAERPAPQFDSADALREAMMADALKTKHRMAKSQMTEQSQVEATSLTNEDIFALIQEAPGITTNQIAMKLRAKSSVILSRLKTLQRKNCIESKLVAGKTRSERAYVAVQGATLDARKATPMRDKLLAYLRENNGATTLEIADHLGCSRQGAVSALARAKQVVNITVERQGHGNQPARYWVEEAAQ